MKKIVLAALVAVASSAAFAQGYTVEGAIGSAHINEDCSGVPNCSNNSTGYKLVGGYGLSKNLAAEISYISYGKASASAYNTQVDVKTHGFGIGLAYQLPLNEQFNFTLRGGVASNHTSVSSSGIVNISDSKSKTALTLGLGAAYALSKSLSVTAGYDISKANDTTGDMNVSLFSLGLKYGF